MLPERSVFELHNTIQRHLCFRTGRVYGIRGWPLKTCLMSPGTTHLCGFEIILRTSSVSNCDRWCGSRASKYRASSSATLVFAQALTSHIYHPVVSKFQFAVPEYASTSAQRLTSNRNPRVANAKLPANTVIMHRCVVLISAAHAFVATTTNRPCSLALRSSILSDDVFPSTATDASSATCPMDERRLREGSRLHGPQRTTAAR